MIAASFVDASGKAVLLDFEGAYNGPIVKDLKRLWRDDNSSVEILVNSLRSNKDLDARLQFELVEEVNRIIDLMNNS